MNKDEWLDSLLDSDEVEELSREARNKPSRPEEPAIKTFKWDYAWAYSEGLAAVRIRESELPEG